MLVLKQLAKERNGVVQDYQVAFAKILEQVLNHQQGGLPRLPVLAPCLHEKGVVEADPHRVVIDAIINIENHRPDRALNETQEVGHLQQSGQISDRFDQLLVRIVLDEAARIMLEEKLNGAADFDQKGFRKLLGHLAVLNLGAGALAASLRRALENFDQRGEDVHNTSFEEDAHQRHKELF